MNTVYLRYSLLSLLYITSLLATGCATAPLGSLNRYDDHGQQIICWSPGLKFNGLAQYIADKVEAH